MTMNLKNKAPNKKALNKKTNNKTSKKQCLDVEALRKKEIKKLKSAYKAGKLNFSSKDIAIGILEDFKKGISTK